MKTSHKISLLAFTIILLCTIAISKINALEIVEQPIGAIVYQSAPPRQPREVTRNNRNVILRQQVINPERRLQGRDTTRQPSRQNQIDRSIARLRQILQEAEEIRERINNMARESQSQTRRPQPRNLDQRPQSAVGEARENPRDMEQNQPEPQRPRIERVINNIPQAIERLRDTLNSNIERVQNNFQKVQERVIDIQAENERLKNENQELREENERLRNHIHELESR